VKESVSRMPCAPEGVTGIEDEEEKEEETCSRVK
jgi:hypothetical protein